MKKGKKNDSFFFFYEPKLASHFCFFSPPPPRERERVKTPELLLARVRERQSLSRLAR